MNASSRTVVVPIVLVLSALRVLVFPDFRWGIISVVFVQLIYPIVLPLALLTFEASPGRRLSLWAVLGLVVVLLATLEGASYIRASMTGDSVAEDLVGDALILISLAAQFGGISEHHWVRLGC